MLREREHTGIIPLLISPALRILGCWIITPLEFMVALRKEPERGRKALQHMASITTLVICSDSQVESLFIQVVLLSKPQYVWL